MVVVVEVGEMRVGVVMVEVVMVVGMRVGVVWVGVRTTEVGDVLVGVVMVEVVMVGGMRVGVVREVVRTMEVVVVRESDGTVEAGGCRWVWYGRLFERWGWWYEWVLIPWRWWVRGSVWGGWGLVESPECHFPEPGGEVPS
jgi:hypothetical protein